jgi:hypothetical protein
MLIPVKRSPECRGSEPTLLEFCGGQRNSIPEQLKFSATADATPVRWLPPIVWVAHFPTADSVPTFRTRSRHPRSLAVRGKPARREPAPPVASAATIYVENHLAAGAPRTTSPGLWPMLGFGRMLTTGRR